MARLLILFALAAATAFPAAAAPKIRLIYGKDWSQAGCEVKKTLESSAFKRGTQGRYMVECIDESDRPAQGNLGSLKLPAIFVISEQGNCFCILENVPMGASAEVLLRTIDKANKLRLAAEKKPLDTADACGQFLQSMEKFVGGPKRVISKGFYDNIYEKLKRLDPEDKTGWQRHFEMGDGISLVIKATTYRTGGVKPNGKNLSMGDAEGDRLAATLKGVSQAECRKRGEAFIEEEFKKPRKHLSKEQTQALLMAQFALWRDDPAKKDESIKRLKRVAEFGEDTLWGTSALGWLNIMGEPQLSVYWGWHKGDFKGPKLDATVKYGVGWSFQKPGKYTITFEKDSGVNLKIDSLVLKCGDEDVATLKNPTVAGDKTVFEYALPRAYAKGKITAMVVKGSADPAGNSTGSIKIHRQILKPRK
ncbi:MAG: hypothetical protein IJJ51_00225 [Kiritimatiellae bacterium]|nr:hypothetical protein [Kiritimatiellia bacterium]